MQGQFKISFSLLGLALGFSSCKVHHRLQSIPLEVNQDATFVHQEEGRDFNYFWWREFNQPALNSAIESAAFDVCQHWLQLESTKSALIPVEESIRIAGYQLDILMGRLPEAPCEVDIDIASIELPPFPNKGRPLDLIRRRPDLKALARQVKALDVDVEEAIADLYPELSFSAGYWYKTENVLCFLRNGLLDAALSLAIPLFDGGKKTC